MRAPVLLLSCLLVMAFRPVFTAEPIPPQVEARMRGSSYPDGATVSLGDLRYLRLSYYDFNGVPQTGTPSSSSRPGISAATRP